MKRNCEKHLLFSHFVYYYLCLKAQKINVINRCNEIFIVTKGSASHWKTDVLITLTNLIPRCYWYVTSNLKLLLINKLTVIVYQEI